MSEQEPVTERTERRPAAGDGGLPGSRVEWPVWGRPASSATRATRSPPPSCPASSPACWASSRVCLTAIAKLATATRDADQRGTLDAEVLQQPGQISRVRPGARR
jgi:hypothetical protein